MSKYKKLKRQARLKCGLKDLALMGILTTFEGIPLEDINGFTEEALYYGTSDEVVDPKDLWLVLEAAKEAAEYQRLQGKSLFEVSYCLKNLSKLPLLAKVITMIHAL